LKDDRNDMAHHKGIRLDDQFSEQYFMSESAYWLYVFQLLRLMDAPDAVFDQIVQPIRSALAATAWTWVHRRGSARANWSAAIP
jgi:hypothetical protein